MHERLYKRDTYLMCLFAHVCVCIYLYIYIPASSCGCQIIAFAGKIAFGYWRLFPGEQRQFLCLLKWWAYDGVPHQIHAHLKAMKSSKLENKVASHNQMCDSLVTQVPPWKNSNSQSFFLSRSHLDFQCGVGHKLASLRYAWHVCCFWKQGLETRDVEFEHGSYHACFWAYSFVVKTFEVSSESLGCPKLPCRTRMWKRRMANQWSRRKLVVLK